MKTVLLLYDEITPALAKDFVREMTKLPPTAEVTIAINSPGGSVPAGDAIAAAIDRHKGPTTCRIDGVAASAASYIAMFADRVIMARGSFLMLHCPSIAMVGTADDLESLTGTLRAIESRYARVYSRRSGMPAAEVLRLMKVESWFGAEQAIQAGLADEIDAGLARARTVSARVLQFQRVPMEVRAMTQGGGGGGGTRTAEQRARLRRRYQLIAAQARFARDPKRDEQDRERGARMRRRCEMQATVDAINADDRAVDAAERAAIKARQQRDYYYNWQGVPHGQRR